MDQNVQMALDVVRDAGSLPVTWNTIDDCTREILAWKNTIGLGVIRIGQALIWAKERLPHGQFETWLRDSVEFSPSSARNFMRIAREVDEGSAIAKLPYTKVMALLDVPREEREQFAEEHDAEHATAAELKRLAKELADEKKRADGLQEDYDRALREMQHQRGIIDGNAEAAEAESQRAARAEHLLRESREELSALRSELALVKARPAEVVEKVPDDYLDLKKRAAAAEAEADRLADQLDQLKARQMESEMTSEPDIASRVISAIGGFMTQAAQMPQRIRGGGDCVSDEDIRILWGQMDAVKRWLDAMHDAVMDQPRFRG